VAFNKLSFLSPAEEALNAETAGLFIVQKYIVNIVK